MPWHELFLFIHLKNQLKNAQKIIKLNFRQMPNALFY